VVGLVWLSKQDRTGDITHRNRLIDRILLRDLVSAARRIQRTNNLARIGALKYVRNERDGFLIPIHH
jgi:hypothetical protein